MVVDGLRYSMVDENEGLKAVLTQTNFIDHGKVIRVSAEIPTLCFPNFVAMTSGASPEVSG